MSSGTKRKHEEDWDFLDLTGSTPVYSKSKSNVAPSTATSKAFPSTKAPVYQPQAPMYPSLACPTAYASYPYYQSMQLGSSVSSAALSPPPKRARRSRVKSNDHQTGGEKPEKRGAITKKKCPQNIFDRVDRVMSQRFFMLDRRRNGSELREEFSVLGSTGNVYTVVIDKTPSCNCPDATKGNHCKHILFIFLKVLQVPQSSHVWYQKALLTSELIQIFTAAPLAPNSLAHQRVREAYARATGRSVNTNDVGEGASSEPASTGARRQPTAEDDCPICYEGMHGAAESLLVWCETCGNAVHQGCFAEWAKSSPNKHTCVFCRSPWVGASALGKGKGKTNAGMAASEGYLNLGAVAGLSGVRDTSTYHHGARLGMRYYG
ncbi:hypothetical protein F5I97DRAFT_1843539 [Phlebopus sp. FC_14]|nr:hypothetical protein F5I97DRAFT_1843539 [Phlebopus sp. FC_14]